ncbi:MAG: SPFH/Band 7/PHB domain protein [Akkermansia sp.]|nr:SPFH/Band 7/PHB domain protein [Akkermansia sp.]MBR6577182.1 SPFH/Band 7/PHB domain protein [Akkermansia sp.]
MFIFTVKQGHCAIVEMFGKPTSVKKSGLQFRIPILQKLRDVSPAWGTLTNKDGYFIELTEQLLDTQPRSCITKDNATMQMNCVVRWRITDPIKAVYEVERLHQSLIELVLNEMRSLIGSRNLDEILSSRSEMSEKVTLAVSSTVARWGIAITSIEIKELTTDTETREAMLRQMEAERISRSTALQAEGESTAKVRLAEAEKQAAILRAQGASEALRLTAEAETAYLERLASIIGAEAAAKVLMNRQALEGYATITTNPASTVYLPNSVPAVIDLKR